MIQRLDKKRPMLAGEKGASLVEALIAVAITAIAVPAFLGAFSTGSLAVGKVDGQVTARNLARSQLEYTKSQAYIVAPASYDNITPVPVGYSISVEAAAVNGRDENVQKITVTVQRNGKVLLVMEGFKLHR